jgi:pimeloyl-ACP methyl ester carboxylesterase
MMKELSQEAALDGRAGAKGVEPDSRLVEVQSGDERIRLHYLSWQAGSGGHIGLPPLIMVHATGFLARLWQPVAEHLAEPPPNKPNRLGFWVYAYDSRGHGDSDKPAPQGERITPDGPYGWIRFARDLKGFMDTFRFRNAPLVGHSAGGAAALYLAAMHPQYVSRVVAIEPIVIPPNQFSPGDERRNDLAEGAVRRRMVWASVDEIVKSYRSRPTFSRWREDVLRLYAEHGTFRRDDGKRQLKCPGEIESEVFHQSRSLDVWSALPLVRCPVLVLRGEHTDGYLQTLCESVAARVPNGRLAVVGNAGHLAPMEQPERVADMILEFLEG